MQKCLSNAEKIIKFFVYGMIIVNFLFICVALFSNNNEGEAKIGNFRTQDFNEGWTLETSGNIDNITLPVSVDAEKGESIIIKKNLPKDLQDGNCIMVRSSMEDVYIYVNGELREEYTTESIDIPFYYLPSSYVVAKLSPDDSESEITIKYVAKASGKLNEIQLGIGNNVWFSVLKNNIAVNAMAFVVLILGILLLFASFIMKRISQNNKASFFLGLLMLDISIWVFSESNLRQLIFSRPILAGYFAYLSVELIGVLACLYFDEVQHKKHHKHYLFIEIFSCIQLMLNVVLHFARIAELYQTLIFSHLWMVLGLCVAIVNIIFDIRSKNIVKYKATAIGMVCFLLTGLCELVAFYILRFHVFGIYVCIGLLMLTIATVIQVLIDQIKSLKEHENAQTNMVVNTIKTVAGAIDAKDEYTGGHSERVGHYSTILAREIAKDYGFTEEDLLRIHYIGNMHDIGKIGVADSILNKAGRLTDDEFSLMKKHVDIGAELMKGMNHNIEGLVDGILYHHERFDGKGYPKGLSGTDIPLIARIICLADCYDAMTTNRVYRRRLSDEEVRGEFVRCSGTQFDPELAEVFISLMDRGEIAPYTVKNKD